MSITKCWTSLALLSFLAFVPNFASCEIHGKTLKVILNANKNGPYLGLVIPNLFELSPFLQHPSYKPTNLTIDFAGMYMHKFLQAFVTWRQCSWTWRLFFDLQGGGFDLERLVESKLCLLWLALAWYHCCQTSIALRAHI